MIKGTLNFIGNVKGRLQIGNIERGSYLFEGYPGTGVDGSNRRP